MASGWQDRLRVCVQRNAPDPDKRKGSRAAGASAAVQHGAAPRSRREQAVGLLIRIYATRIDPPPLQWAFVLLAPVCVCPLLRSCASALARSLLVCLHRSFIKKRTLEALRGILLLYWSPSLLLSRRQCRATMGHPLSELFV